MGLFSKNHTVHVTCDEHPEGHSISFRSKQHAEGQADVAASMSGVTKVQVNGKTVYSGKAEDD